MLPREVLEFKRSVELRYSSLVYDGLWFSPLTRALDAFVTTTQERVTGEVAVELYKGAWTVVGRTSPNALYRAALATYSEGDQYRAENAEGFIYVWGLPVRTWASLQSTANTPALSAAAPLGKKPTRRAR